MDSKFNAEKAPEPVGMYPHARKVGNLLFLSGVGPRERNTQKIPGVELDENGEISSYDIADQCHSVFKNVRTILEASGSSWEGLVDVTVFLTNMKDDFKTFNEIYAAYFGCTQNRVIESKRPSAGCRRSRSRPLSSRSVKSSPH